MVAIVSCLQLPASAPARNPTPSPVAVTLSSGSPEALVGLTVTGAQIHLSVDRIDNPSRQEVGIRVALNTCPLHEKATYDLGLVTPYPIDRTGLFVLQLPSEATSNLKSCNGAAAVDLTLVPLIGQQPLREGTVIMATVRSA